MTGTNQKLREALQKLTHYAECQVAVFSSGRAYLDMTLLPKLCADAHQALALPTTEPTPATPEDMKVYNGIADNYSRSTHAQEPAKSVSVDCDGKPTAFVHWPLRGAPQLVWCSNQALGDAIRKAYEGYQPDLLLFTREALATQPQAQELPGERTLPKLPTPKHRGVESAGSYFDSFTAAQMQEYARAALETKPVPELTEDEIAHCWDNSHGNTEWMKAKSFYRALKAKMSQKGGK